MQGGNNKRSSKKEKDKKCLTEQPLGVIIRAWTGKPLRQKKEVLTMMNYKTFVEELNTLTMDELYAMKSVVNRLACAFDTMDDEEAFNMCENLLDRIDAQIAYLDAEEAMVAEEEARANGDPELYNDSDCL